MEEDDKARSEATFRYTVHNFSKLMLKRSARSPVFYVRNLAWKIVVIPTMDDDWEKTTLALFLQCKNESNCSSWSCNADVDLRLLSVHPDVKTASRNFKRLWSSKDNGNLWGFEDFMAWNDVLDPKKGFIKDNAITVEVHVYADVPHIVPMDHFDLIVAIQRQSLHEIKSLSINRTLINTVDDEGNTPLCYAINSENIEIVEYLIKSKANVCKPAKNEKPPLLVAVETGNINIIKLLLKHGAGNTIQSALFTAVTLQNLKIVKLLIEHGALLDVIYKDGHTVLTKSLEIKNFDMVKVLIEHGANVNMPENGKTPLLIAVETGNLDIIKLLLRHGAGDTIQSAFCQAVILQNLEIIKLLTEHDALDININSKDGHTALTKSLENKNFDIVKVLIEHGADVNMAKSDGTSPLSLALKIGNSEICNYLINNGGKLASDSDQAFEYLSKYIEDDNFEMVQILIELGAKLNKTYECGETPLTKAAKLENFEIVEYLIKKGANVNLCNIDGEAPLQVAASNRDILIAKLLIQSKARLDLAGEEIEEFAASHEDFRIYLKMLNRSSDCFVNDTRKHSFADCGQEAADP